MNKKQTIYLTLISFNITLILLNIMKLIYGYNLVSIYHWVINISLIVLFYYLYRKEDII